MADPNHQAPREKRPVGRPRADGRPPITKKQVLETAARLFAVKGFSGTSVRMIADEMGIHPPTIFQLFGDKDSILRELYSSIFGIIADYYDAIVARGAAPAETIAAIVYRDVTTIVAGDSSLKAVIGLPELRQERFGDLRALRERCIETLQRQIAAGVADDTFIECDTRLAAEQLFVLVETSMHAPFPEKLGSAEHQAAQAMRMALRALLCDPSDCDLIVAQARAMEALR